MKKNKNNVYDATPYFFYDDFDTFSKKIDGIEYYFKHSYNIPYELVADEVFRLLGLDCVNHEIAKIGSKYLLFSKSFKKDNCNYYNCLDLYCNLLKIKSIEQLKNNEIERAKLNNLQTIWDMLSYKDYDKEDIRNVITDLIKQYTMSIILLDPDFHGSNWIIEENNKHIKLMPKYDNESAFESDIFGMAFNVDTFDNTGSSVDSLKRLLAVSSYEDKQIVYDLILRCNDKVIITAFNNVINKYNNIFNLDTKKTLNNILTIFNKQRDAIIDMIKEMEYSHGR